MSATLGPAIRAALLTNSTVSTAVGGVRISPIMLPPEAEIPAIVYMQIAGKPLHDTSSSLTSRARVQLTVFAATYDALQDLSDAIIGHLQDFSGTAASVIIIQIWVDSVFETRDTEANTWKKYITLTVIYEGAQ